MAALAKLLKEAGLDETKTILGWDFDFRRMLVSLPENKFTAWSEAIQTILYEGCVTVKELENNIGRLVHLGLVLPYVHHFMSRLCELQRRARNRHQVKVTDIYAEDSKLIIFFLKKEKDGVDLNLIAYRKPTHVHRSDSCPGGLGGFSHEGWAWLLPTRSSPVSSFQQPP